MASYTIHQMPESERPRERLMQYGADVMSTAELIAIVLGSGTRGSSVLQLAQELLSRFGSRLADVTIEELCQIKGMGSAKAVQLKAALTLGRRTSKTAVSNKIVIKEPLQVYHYIKDLFDHEKREVFIALLLDAKSQIITHKIISIGTLTQTIVHPREVFYPAIRHKAASLILTHNHPSGDPTPSKEDILVTHNLINVGQAMCIPINDHIIIGENKFISLRERGVKFN